MLLYMFASVNRRDTIFSMSTEHTATDLTPIQLLGAHLRQTRLRAGLTVPGAVHASGMSRPFVYMIEAGTRRPSGEVLAKLLGAYGASGEEADRANRLHDSCAVLAV
jgi:hypothetical protein